MSFQYLEKLKDSSIQTLCEGTDVFNKATNPDEKKKGYQIFVSGLKGLIEYGKAQQDATLRNTVLSKCQDYTVSAEKMKKHLENFVQAPPQNNQPSQMGNNSNQQPQQGKPKEENGEKKKIVEGDEEKDKLRDSLGDAIVREKPNVKWSDIAGLEKAKESLQEAVILPMKFPEIFVGQRKPWKGILLYGVLLFITLASWNWKNLLSQGRRH